MTKELNVVLDDEQTITLSNACNMYGHHHYLIYNNEGQQCVIAKGYEPDTWYLIDAHKLKVEKKYEDYCSFRFLFSDLLKKGYKIKLIFDDEE